MDLASMPLEAKRQALALMEARARIEDQAKAEAERRRVSENAEQIRERCRTLSGFVREAWAVLEPNTAYVHGWHIDAMAAHLEAVSEGQIIRLLMNVPPGTLKSLLTGVFWCAWEWGPLGRPATRILGSSYNEDYSKRDARRMRDLITSDWFQALWPTPLVRAGESEFENSSTGFRKGVPISRLTGGRADRVILDDPHSTEGAESEAERRATIRIFTESVTTRLNSPERSAIVVVMQRLHENDVSGVILSRDLGYERLCLPMEYEPERARTTSIGFRDPRTEPGELLFPARFPREVVERDKKAMGQFAVAGQFQQRPAPRDGGLFKRDWFEIVGGAPPATRKVRAWDLAATAPRAGRSPDWTVGLRVSRSADGVFFVEACSRFQGTPAAVEAAIKQSAALDGVSTTVRLPQDPGQAGRAQADTLIKLLAGYSAVAKPITGDKATRATPAATQAEIGNIKLVRGPWNEAFLDEVCLFPGGNHDDQVDALADAINHLALGSTYTLDNI